MMTETNEREMTLREWCDRLPKHHKVNEQLNHLENEYIMQGCLLESIQELLDGKQVSGFMMSFPIIRRVWEEMQK